MKLCFLIFLFSTSVFAGSTWFNSAGDKGQAIVIHGLNNKPSVMNPIVNELVRNGYDVLRVSLAGHTGSIENMKLANHISWRRDFDQAYRKFSRRSEKNGGKNLIVAYSLGGLVSVSNLLNRVNHQIHRMVLLAPALSVKLLSNAIRASFIFSNDTIIPSASPKEFQAQRGVSVGAYKGLFSLLNVIHQNERWNRVNIPTQVFIHPGDELVSLSGLDSLIADKGLNNWDLIEIDNSQKTSPHGYDHLIINSDLIGEQEWIQKVSPAFK